jgi:hypothetical protein
LRQRINDEIVEIINVLEAGVQALLHEEQICSAAPPKASAARFEGSAKSPRWPGPRGITDTEELYSLLSKQREEARISRSKKEMVVRVKVISAATAPLQPLCPAISRQGLHYFTGPVGVSPPFMDFDHSFKNAEDVQRYLADILASRVQKPSTTKIFEVGGQAGQVARLAGRIARRGSSPVAGDMP